MPALPVLQYPDERLRQGSATVTEFDERLEDELANLADTLYSTSGIAMSAPQIDDRRRILLLDLSTDRNAAEFYINPEIVDSRAPGLVQESCLSIPGVVGNVVRATRVRVRAQDRYGQFFERDLQGMHAVCMQHEMDHFTGVLFIDRLSSLSKFRMRTAAATGALFRSVAGALSASNNREDR